MFHSYSLVLVDLNWPQPSASPQVEAVAQRAIASLQRAEEEATVGPQDDGHRKDTDGMSWDREIGWREVGW